jgi:hypothetical protein
MRYNQLIESYVNVFDEAGKRKYADQVWDLLQQAYAKLPGGFATAATVDELIEKSSLWKMQVRDGHVYAVSIYKDQNGRKSIAAATDRSPQGKADYVRLKDADVKLNRAWAEVSGRPEQIMRDSGATAIPAKFASALTKKEILDYNSDGYHYTRFIGGSPHEKIIYGFVTLDAQTAQALELQGIDLRELPPNMKLEK